MIVAPLLRGLYYYLEFTQAQMYLGAIFIFYGCRCFLRREKQLSIGWLEILLFIYIVFNILSLLTAVHIKDAVFGTFKALNYVIIFFLVRDLTRELSWRNRLVVLLFISSVVASVAAFLVELELISLATLTVDANWAFSTLEYVNAYAAFAAVGVLLGLGLAGYFRSILAKALLGMGIYLNTFGVIISMSRGTWILLGLLLVTYLLLKGSKGFWKSFYFSALIIFTVVFTSKEYLEALSAGELQTAQNWLLIGLVLTGLGTAFVFWVPRLLTQIRLKRHYSLVLPWVFALGVAIVGLAYFSYVADVYPTGGGRIVSGNVITTLESIGGQDNSYQARLEMSKLAGQMVMDRPLTGAGGGGWNALYHQYQDKFYWSSEVHNHYLQIGIENGILGMLAYLAFWLGLIAITARYFYKRRGQTSWPLGLSVGLASLLLLLHSAMDFELSLPAVALTLWVLGAMLSNQVIKKRKVIKNIKIPTLSVIILLALCGLTSLGLGYREHQAQALVQEGARELVAGNYPQALEHYEKAFALSPYTGETAANLAQLHGYTYYKTKNEENKTKAVEYAQSSVKLTPSYIPGSQKVAQTYWFIGDKEGRLLEQERLTKVAPKMVEAWSALSQSYLDNGLAFLRQQDVTKAREKLEKVLNAMDTVQENYVIAKEYYIMRPTPQLYLSAGQAALLLGHKETAQEYLEQAFRYKETKETAGLWLSVAFENSDEKKSANYFKQYVNENAANLVAYEKIKEWYLTLN